MDYFKSIAELIPYLPIFATFLTIFITVEEQFKIIPDRKHPVLDARMNVNLTLVGLTFAIISVLVTLFKDNELEKVSGTIFLFSLGLSCFLGSYILLHFRMKNIYDSISDGLTDNGIWVIIVGLISLFESLAPLKSSSLLFKILAGLFVVYIVLKIIMRSIAMKKG